MVRVSGSQIASLFLFLRYGGFPCFAFFFSSFFFLPELSELGPGARLRNAMRVFNFSIAKGGGGVAASVSFYLVFRG